MSADLSTEILEANAEPDEPTNSRTILQKGQVVEVGGMRFKLAMHCVVEGRKGDMLTVGLKPE